MGRTPRPTVELQAAPARTEDVGSNVVRLPRTAFDLLGLDEGDPVHIEGSTSLWARALRAHPDDEGIEVARVALGEAVLPEVREGGTVRLGVARARPAGELEVVIDQGEEVSAADLRSALEGEGVLLVGDRLRLTLETDAEGFDVDVGIAGLSLVRVIGRKESLDPASVWIEASVPEGPVRVVAETELRQRREGARRGGRRGDTTGAS